MGLGWETNERISDAAWGGLTSSSQSPPTPLVQKNLDSAVAANSGSRTTPNLDTATSSRDKSDLGNGLAHFPCANASLAPTITEHTLRNEQQTWIQDPYKAGCHHNTSWFARSRAKLLVGARRHGIWHAPLLHKPCNAHVMVQGDMVRGTLRRCRRTLKVHDPTL